MRKSVFFLSPKYTATGNSWVRFQLLAIEDFSQTNRNQLVYIEPTSIKT